MIIHLNKKILIINSIELTAGKYENFQQQKNEFARTVNRVNQISRKIMKIKLSASVHRRQSNIAYKVSSLTSATAIKKKKKKKKH